MSIFLVLCYFAFFIRTVVIEHLFSSIGNLFLDDLITLIHLIFKYHSGKLKDKSNENYHAQTATPAGPIADQVGS